MAGYRGNRFIVAEVSKNWGPETPTDRDFLCHRFEEVIAVNLDRGYKLHSYELHRMMTGVDVLNETIIAVFERIDP